MRKFSQDGHLLLHPPDVEFARNPDMGTLFDYPESSSYSNPQFHLPPRCTRGVLAEYEMELVQEVISKINDTAISSIVASGNMPA